ncbi:MAG: MGH1-like glycoside hydrolase domain-containing protein [Planctomycetota bacterium]
MTPTQLIVLLTFAVSFVMQAESRPSATASSPLLFPERRPRLDDVLSRPYDANVPFGCVGDRLWAASPQGFGFDDGVNYVYINNFVPFKLKIPGFKPGKATYYPSHVHVEGEPGMQLSASASFTYAIDGVDRPLTKPFAKEKRWTCWNSKKREDWYAVDFGQTVKVNAVTLYFFDDAPNGGCRPPEKVGIEAYKNGEWKPVTNLTSERANPTPGANRFTFNYTETDQLRFVFKNKGENFFTGLYGVDPEYTIETGASVNRNIQVSTDKFITEDDVMGVVVTIKNTSREPTIFNCSLEYPTVDTREAGMANWNRPSPPLHITGLSATLLNVEMNAPFCVVMPRNKKADCKIDTKFRSLGNPTTIEINLAGGENIKIGFFCSIHEDNKKALERLESYFVPLLDGKYDEKEFFASQNQWSNSNVATFDCSDPFVTKQFWHRAYVLKKNFMNPRMGKLQHRTSTEGRWHSEWYQNVISYGAAHQIREARWFADPSYSWGHLQTFCENPRPDGVFPSHITPDGQKGGQYTDWISSTAIDLMAVHPNTELLKKNFPALAKNAKAWIDVYDKDGDFLPVVDSHWWTGMEWQPSFFYFYDYLAKKGEDDLERVDLAAYAYGNAKNVAECARLLGNESVGAELETLANNIKNAVEKKLWNAEWQFFLSNRYQDDKPALVKEEIGVYPFYFGLPAAGKGYEAAWKSIIDPAEMWGPWPVRSCSLKCAAYAPGVFWPVGENVATGCMWNGPTWPHANSIILTAMARTLREYPRCELNKKHLFELFNSFTKAQFKNGDINNPWTGEYYHAETGEWLTAERDYNHSTYLDILIPDIIGLVPRNDNVLEIDPLMPSTNEGGWSYFILDGQYYRGHYITILWDEPDGKKQFGAAADEGLTVFVDKKKRAHRRELGKLTLPLVE